MVNSTAGAEPSTSRESRPQQLPPFRLSNPSKYCYLNSYVYAMWLVSTYCNIPNLPQVIRVKDGPLLARHLFGFHLLGWRNPERQHDVAELIDYLNPRLSALHITGQVESRQQTSAGVARHYEGHAAKCIRLIKPPRTELSFRI